MKRLAQTYRGPLHIFYTLIYVSVAIALAIFNSELIMVPIVGSLIIVFAGYQLIHLLRNREKTLTIKLYLAEIAGQIIIGGIFIYRAWIANQSLGVWFGYLLGGLMIVRGTLYFYGTRVTTHTEDLLTFFIHVAALIAGTYLIIQGTFTPAVMSGIVITVALKRGIKTAYIAYKSYKNPTPQAVPSVAKDLNSIEWQETGSDSQEVSKDDA